MKLGTLFRHLSYGELSNLAITMDAQGNLGTGGIVEARLPQLVSYVNDGLLELHKRFILVEKDLLIQQVEGITNYHLHRKFAEFGSRGQPAKVPYIKDLPCEPFDSDVITILAVYGRAPCHRHHDASAITTRWFPLAPGAPNGYRPHESGKLPLNDPDDPRSVFTPKPDVLQIPFPREGEPISVVYQARHKPLCEERPTVQALLDQWIDLPFGLEKALQSWVAAEVHSHLGSDGSQAAAQKYLGMYEAICTDAEAKDTTGQTQSQTGAKFHSRGFA